MSTESDYEHAGEWDCEACGETFDVETKLDPLIHALACGDDSTAAGNAGGHEGYRRRRRELERVAEGSA